VKRHDVADGPDIYDREDVVCFGQAHPVWACDRDGQRWPWLVALGSSVGATHRLLLLGVRAARAGETPESPRPSREEWSSRLRWSGAGVVVLKGASRKSLARWERERRRPPVVTDHEHSVSAVIGSLVDAREDHYGLYVKGIFSSTAAAQDARTKVREGHLSGLSIFGGIVASSYATVGSRQVRKLSEVDLLEVSLTPWPANTQALISSAKARANAEIETLIKDLQREVSTAARRARLPTCRTPGRCSPVSARAPPMPSSPSSRPGPPRRRRPGSTRSWIGGGDGADRSWPAGRAGAGPVVGPVGSGLNSDMDRGVRFEAFCRELRGALGAVSKATSSPDRLDRAKLADPRLCLFGPALAGAAAAVSASAAAVVAALPVEASAGPRE
jgi:HK97 family phage prohead protease